MNQTLYQKYEEGLKELFKHFVTEQQNKEIISIIPLLKNSNILLQGPPGTGKSTLARLIATIFFGKNEIAEINLNESLLPEDVLYHLNVGKLTKEGIEQLEPRELFQKAVIFFNEGSRTNKTLQSALLSILAERKLTILNYTWNLKDGIILLDMNPADEGGDRNLSWAFMDRFTLALRIEPINILEQTKLLQTKFNKESNQDVQNILSYQEIQQIWSEIENIEVSDGVSLYATLLFNEVNACIYDPLRKASLYKTSCRSGGCMFYSNLCSAVERPASIRALQNVIKIAKALAWLHEKTEVGKNEIVKALPHALAPAVLIKRDELINYKDNSTLFLEIEIPKMAEQKRNIFIDWAKAVLNDDFNYLKALSERDLALRKLYEQMIEKQKTKILQEVETLGQRPYSYSEVLKIYNEALKLNIDDYVRNKILEYIEKITFYIIPKLFEELIPLIQQYEPKWDKKLPYMGQNIAIEENAGTITLHVRSDLIGLFKKEIEKAKNKLTR